MEKDEPSEASGRNVAEHGDWRAWVIEIRGSLGAVVGILALFQFPRWLKQQAFFLAQLWRLEEQSQGVGKVGFFWRARRGNLFMPLSQLLGLLEILAVLGL